MRSESGEESTGHRDVKEIQEKEILTCENK